MHLMLSLGIEERKRERKKQLIRLLYSHLFSSLRLTILSNLPKKKNFKIVERAKRIWNE